MQNLASGLPSTVMLRYGDVIGLLCDNLGYFGLPCCQEEPIPERSSPQSHIQIVPFDTTTAVFPKDYSERCMFRLLRDKGTDTDAQKDASGEVCATMVYLSLYLDSFKQNYR
jgi:hypothetical protein